MEDRKESGNRLLESVSDVADVILSFDQFYNSILRADINLKCMYSIP